MNTRSHCVKRAQNAFPQGVGLRICGGSRTQNHVNRILRSREAGQSDAPRKTIPDSSRRPEGGERSRQRGQEGEGGGRVGRGRAGARAQARARVGEMGGPYRKFGTGLGGGRNRRAPSACALTLPRSVEESPPRSVEFREPFLQPKRALSEETNRVFRECQTSRSPASENQRLSSFSKQASQRAN